MTPEISNQTFLSLVENVVYYRCCVKNDPSCVEVQMKVFNEMHISKKLQQTAENT